MTLSSPTFGSVLDSPRKRFHSLLFSFAAGRRVGGGYVFLVRAWASGQWGPAEGREPGHTSLCRRFSQAPAGPGTAGALQKSMTESL